MNNSNSAIGIFGGTFDPFHNCHLSILKTFVDMLPLTKVHVIPAKQPALRQQPETSAEDRLHMVRLATSDMENVVCDDREIKRIGTSYTIDTLRSLANEYTDSVFILALGRDAFDRMDQWSEWQLIFSFCSVAVFHRPDSIHIERPAWLPESVSIVRKTDGRVKAGHVYYLENKPCYGSATEVRNVLSEGQGIQHLVPSQVSKFIESRKLYV